MVSSSHRELSITMRASGSIFLISLAVSIPSMPGIMISIVTTSGENVLYFSIPASPFLACATTSYPAAVTISFISMAIKGESSMIIKVFIFIPLCKY